MSTQTMLKIPKGIALLIVVFCLSACGYLIQPKVTQGIQSLKKGAYVLDPAHATVLFKLNHMGFSTFVGRFNTVNAQLDFDPANIAAAKLTAEIDVASIDVNNRDLEETLRSSSWFDVERYPKAQFETTSVTLVDANSADFTGELSLHGVRAPLVLHIKFNGGGNNLLTGSYTLGFSALGRIQRSVYGVDNLIPAIGDDVDIEVFVEFKRN